MAKQIIRWGKFRLIELEKDERDDLGRFVIEHLEHDTLGGEQWILTAVGDDEVWDGIKAALLAGEIILSPSNAVAPPMDADIPKRRCGSCLYWTVNMCECRRRAPDAALDRVNCRMWPRTRADDWCGDWECDGSGR